MRKLLPLLLLAGCAANSGVVALGNDVYFVSRQAATGFTGMGVLKAEALTEAGAVCGKMKKSVDVIEEKDARPPYILGNFPKTEIKFRCT